MNVWINGRLVGQWRCPTRAPTEFHYEQDWIASPDGHPLSLSLPFPPDNQPLRGDIVGNYFDNLLPDSHRIRARLQSRFHTDSTEAFDLLRAIGRDCVGAVQLLPEDVEPDNVFRIDVEPLNEADVERILQRTVSSTTASGQVVADEHDIRVAIGGAQEKTALTWHDGRWCRPIGATPTTHILKLPLGLIGNRQADMRTSVENEWLCAQLLAGYGLSVAPCEIQHFGEQKVLVVERFDRRLASSGNYWLRLPQEDFCQATGTPSGEKYESDGGPSLLDIANILQNSETPEADIRTLLTAQLLFWMLAATDGHAKNFSLFLRPGGGFRLTPLYDVLSAWPVTGAKVNLLDYEKLRLAMAVRGKNTHYRLRDIQRRHFNHMALQCGLGPDMEQTIERVIARTASVLEAVSRALPPDFPTDLFAAIADHLDASAQKLSTKLS